jgi:hypothetical protein
MKIYYLVFFLFATSDLLGNKVKLKMETGIGKLRSHMKKTSQEDYSMEIENIW